MTEPVVEMLKELQPIVVRDYGETQLVAVEMFDKMQSIVV